MSDGRWSRADSLNQVLVSPFYKVFTINLTKEGFRMILIDKLAPFVANAFQGPVSVIQDNAPTHTFALDALNVRWVSVRVMTRKFN